MAVCKACGSSLYDDQPCSLFTEEQRERHKIAALESIAASLVKLANPLMLSDLASAIMDAPLSRPPGYAKDTQAPR